MDWFFWDTKRSLWSSKYPLERCYGRHRRKGSVQDNRHREGEPLQVNEARVTPHKATLSTVLSSSSKQQEEKGEKEEEEEVLLLVVVVAAVVMITR